MLPHVFYSNLDVNLLSQSSHFPSRMGGRVVLRLETPPRREDLRSNRAKTVLPIYLAPQIETAIRSPRQRFSETPKKV